MKIHALRIGSVRIKAVQVKARRRAYPARVLDTLTSSRWLDPQPILAWAIEHPDGVVVIDTGDNSRAGEPGYFPRWHPYFRLAVSIEVEPEEEIGPQLRDQGINLSDVRRVVMTHLHTDHAGGLHHFPGTEVLVTAAEYAAARGTLGRVNGYPLQPLAQVVRADPGRVLGGHSPASTRVRCSAAAVTSGWCRPRGTARATCRW